jgi:hypothetical protein
VDDLEVDAIDGQPIARLNLLDGTQPDLRDGPPEATRHDHRGPARDPAQRWRIQVVVVAVADEHRVEVGEQLGQDRPDLAAHGAQALAEHRVREDPKVVHLDEHGGMAEERQARVFRAGGLGRRGGADGSPRIVAGGVTGWHGRNGALNQVPPGATQGRRSGAGDARWPSWAKRPPRTPAIP